MNKFTILSLLIFSVIFLSQCRKDKFATDSSAKLEFSVDTVLFDTVFTTVGSTTHVLKVYNRNNDRINISSIQLEGGSSSNYIMNVDGVNGASHQDIEIDGNDSMYVFVEVTIDPNNLNIPFIVEDNIFFNTNGNNQVVNLAAWGRDAYFHGSLNGISVLPCDDDWFNDKPHVVYGVVAVDSACTLTIHEGTQVYCHARSGLYVYKGYLDINGAINQEVVFQGDRLESSFQEYSGQWGIELDFGFETDFGIEYATITRGGIWIYESPHSEIDFAIIKNGIIGIQVDTLGHAVDDALTLTNTKILNMSAIGLFAQGSRMSGHNNLIANCGQTCGAFTVGGQYQFDYCTFANYWTESTRQSPTFILANNYEDVYGNLQIRNLEDTEFRNCIMYGNNADLSDYDEFVLNIEEEDTQDYKFSYCMVDTDEDVTSNMLRYEEVRKDFEVDFVDPFEDDFHLNDNHVKLRGWNYGVTNLDIEWSPRLTNFNLGCYENN